MPALEFTPFSQKSPFSPALLLNGKRPAVLKQRGDEFYESAQKTHGELFLLDDLLCYGAAFGEGFLKILFDIRDAGHFVKESGTFKMMIEAAIVQINGADDCFSVIADKYLCMHEAGRIFIELYAGSRQPFVMRLCQRIG